MRNGLCEGIIRLLKGRGDLLRLRREIALSAARMASSRAPPAMVAPLSHGSQMPSGSRDPYADGSWRSRSSAMAAT